MELKWDYYINNDLCPLTLFHSQNAPLTDIATSDCSSKSAWEQIKWAQCKCCLCNSGPKDLVSSCIEVTWGVTFNSHVTGSEVRASTWGQWCSLKILTFLSDSRLASVANKHGPRVVHWWWVLTQVHTLWTAALRVHTRNMGYTIEP